MTPKADHGFTVLNLIIFTAIMLFLVYFSIPAYTSIKTTAQDKSFLLVLNSASQLYAFQEDLEEHDIFAGLKTNEARLQILLEKGYIDKIPIARKGTPSFDWSIAEQKWILHSNR